MDARYLLGSIGRNGQVHDTSVHMKRRKNETLPKMGRWGVLDADPLPRFTEPDSSKIYLVLCAWPDVAARMYQMSQYPSVRFWRRHHVPAEARDGATPIPPNVGT